MPRGPQARNPTQPPQPRTPSCLHTRDGASVRRSTCSRLAASNPPAQRAKGGSQAAAGGPERSTARGPSHTYSTCEHMDARAPQRRVHGRTRKATRALRRRCRTVPRSCTARAGHESGLCRLPLLQCAAGIGSPRRAI